MESEVLRFHKGRSGRWGWLRMGMRSLLGMLGSDRAYQSLFQQVLENYQKEFDPSFAATDEMVEQIRAEPINKTRRHLLAHPPLKDAPDPPFPIRVLYGEKDIYGESKERVKRRFPQASIVEIESAGHVPWNHNREAFLWALTEFYHLM
jgi:proline iminopeptidase